MTEYQHEVVTGVLMGDGTINRQNGWNPCLTVNMTACEYLQYLDEVFGILSTGVRMHQTAEQSYNNGGKFGKNTTVENYSDVYRLRTRRLPELHEYASWYDTGKKVWPESVELNHYPVSSTNGPKGLIQWRQKIEVYNKCALILEWVKTRST